MPEPADVMLSCTDPTVGGACGDAEACIASGSFFDLDSSIKCDSDDQVCCRPAPTCSAVSNDGATELQGKCVGKSYCESQQKVSLDGICGGGGDVGVSANSRSWLENFASFRFFCSCA